MGEPEVCPICCDAYNRSTRSKITCAYCHFDACSGCAEKYLLQSTKDADCMSCHQPWSYDTLCSTFSKKFIGGAYRDHREAVLVMREAAMLPATQPLLQNRRNKGTYRVALRALMDERQDLRQRMAILNDEIANTQQAIRTSNFGTTNSSKVFSYACPLDGCRGFIQDDTHQCGVCDTRMCDQCHEIYTSGHVCAPDIVESVKLLKRDTKPCPSCHSMIYKIEGCSQMFCVKCNYVFNWNTGDMDRGPIHNPEWYALQARLNNGAPPRDARDMPCGGLAHWPIVRTALIGDKCALDEYTIAKFAHVHRVIRHIEWMELPRFVVHDNAFLNNVELRMDFLDGIVTKDEFRRKLLLNERALERRRSIHALIHVIVLAVHDIFRRVIHSANEGGPRKEIMSYVNEFTTLHDYYAEQAHKISARFNYCSVPPIDIDVAL